MLATNKAVVVMVMDQNKSRNPLDRIVLVHKKKGRKKRKLLFASGRVFAHENIAKAAVRVAGREVCAHFDSSVVQELVCAEFRGWDQVSKHTVYFVGVEVPENSFPLEGTRGTRGESIRRMTLKELLRRKNFLSRHRKLLNMLT